MGAASRAPCSALQRLSSVCGTGCGAQLCTSTAVVIRLVSSERLENISPRFFQSRLNKTQNINVYCVVGYVRPYFFFSRLVGHGRRRGYELLVQNDVRSFRVSPGAAYNPPPALRLEELYLFSCSEFFCSHQTFVVMTRSTPTATSSPPLPNFEAGGAQAGSP